MGGEPGPTGSEFALASWPARALGAIADGVVIGLVTYLIAKSASLEPPAGVRHLNSYYFVDLGVSFIYSFTLIAGWGRTFGMRFVGIYAVDATDGRTPIEPYKAAVRSLVAGVFTVIPLAAIVDLLWPLWDPRNQTIHDKAAGTLVLRQ